MEIENINILDYGGRVFMKDINAVNKKVCEFLRSENNEVIYKSWLSFAENAQYDGNNIIIDVPNNFIKEAIENRYSSDLEDLYSQELNFSKLVIKSETENYLNLLSSSQSGTTSTSLHMSFVPEYKSYICW